MTVKSEQDREINLCPRALQVLRAQSTLRERMAATGKISHHFVFFTEGSEPFQTVYLPYSRWSEVMETLPARYYISGRLNNPLLVAQEDGHSVETMLRTYAAWIKIKSAKLEDIERIQKAMTGRPSTGGVSADLAAREPLKFPNLATSGANHRQRGGGAER